MLLIAMINIFAFTSCNNEVADGSSTDERKTLKEAGILIQLLMMMK